MSVLRINHKYTGSYDFWYELAYDICTLSLFDGKPQYIALLYKASMCQDIIQKEIRHRSKIFR